MSEPLSKDECREVLRSVFTERASILAHILDEIRAVAAETYPRQRRVLLNIIDLSRRRLMAKWGETAPPPVPAVPEAPPPKPCPTCLGRRIFVDLCETCGGTGRTRREP